MIAALVNPMLAQADTVLVYVMPVIGSMLLSYGIYQVIDSGRSSTRKRMEERLRGQRKEQKLAASVLRRGALGQTKSFADARREGTYAS